MLLGIKCLDDEEYSGLIHISEISNDFVKDISKFEDGEVRFHDIIYSACLLEKETETIKEGEIVEVVTFRGNKIVVKKID